VRVAAAVAVRGVAVPPVPVPRPVFVLVRHHLPAVQAVLGVGVGEFFCLGEGVWGGGREGREGSAGRRGWGK
jgi:hypothetical protein